MSWTLHSSARPWFQLVLSACGLHCTRVSFLQVHPHHQPRYGQQSPMIHTTACSICRRPSHAHLDTDRCISMGQSSVWNLCNNITVAGHGVKAQFELSPCRLQCIMHTFDRKVYQCPISHAIGYGPCLRHIGLHNSRVFAHNYIKICSQQCSWALRCSQCSIRAQNDNSLDIIIACNAQAGLSRQCYEAAILHIG